VLDAELSGRETGYLTSLKISTGVQDYGPLMIEIVVLDYDGDTVAWRVVSDEQGGAWQIGDKTNVIDMCFMSRAAIRYIQQGKKLVGIFDILAQMETLICE